MPKTYYKNNRRVRRSKRIRSKHFNSLFDSIDASQWFSASSFLHHVIRDPIIDWFKFKQKNQSITYNMPYDHIISNNMISNDLILSNNNDNIFSNYIKEKGNEFENEIMDLLKQILNIINPDNVNICKIANTRNDTYSIEKFHATVKAMNDGVPIIYQGVLHNHTNNTFGSPDLIIRSDYINYIVDEEPLTEAEEKHGCRFNSKWHYRIIDIKLCTLKLRADGVGLTNSRLNAAYKVQVGVYNDALGIIQLHTPPTGYILGRGYTYTSCNEIYKSNNALSKLGEIDFETADSFYKEEIESGISWLTRLREEGHEWTTTPIPCIDELYPNMSSPLNDFYKEKKEIADKLGEITLVWQCGVSKRITAFGNNIKSWKDPRCTAESMGIKGKKIAPIINKMLQFNRGEIHKNELIIPRPGHIINNYLNWQSKDKLDFYCDFETISDITDDFEDLPFKGSTNRIFFIGMFYSYKGKWKFQHWLAKDLTPDSEVEILLNWINTMKNIMVKHKKKGQPRIFHWGRAEQSFFASACKRHHVLNSFKPNWINMLKIMKDEVVLIKDVFGFGLKAIANGLSKYGLIETNYIDEETSITNGMNAMLLARKYYNGELKKDVSTSIINELIKYNKKDCIAIYEITQLFKGAPIILN